MVSEKRHLTVVNDSGSKVVEGVTCFSVQAKHNVNCQRTRCKHWINHAAGNNCVLIAAGHGPMTLQEIGSVYGLTRMRICQIEKNIFEKIRNLC